jgi:hypothetical protein
MGDENRLSVPRGAELTLHPLETEAACVDAGDGRRNSGLGGITSPENVRSASDSLSKFRSTAPVLPRSKR